MGRLAFTEPLEILIPVKGQDENFEPTVEWQTGPRFWGRVEPQSASEQIRADQLYSSQRVKITARYPLDVKAKYRIRHRATGDVFEVHGAVNRAYGNRLVEIVATLEEVYA